MQDYDVLWAEDELKKKKKKTVKWAAVTENKLGTVLSRPSLRHRGHECLQWRWMKINATSCEAAEVSISS